MPKFHKDKGTFRGPARVHLEVPMDKIDEISVGLYIERRLLYDEVT